MIQSKFRWEISFAERVKSHLRWRSLLTVLPITNYFSSFLFLYSISTLKSLSLSLRDLNGALFMRLMNLKSFQVHNSHVTFLF